MNARERTIVLACDGYRLPAIVHEPGARKATIGVVVIVGGPQYRIGSHRQFLLLARELAASGIPVLRFDYRGMGDADGAFGGFEAVGPDIEAAVDGLMASCPELDGVVLWGLCDAASAALFYAPDDARIHGLVLLNPWVRTEAGGARTVVRHYYRRRVISLDFWKKLIQGGVNPVRVLRGFADLLRKARTTEDASEALPDRMAQALSRFHGSVLLGLSGNDLTADEFRDTVAGSSRWQAVVSAPHVTRVDFPEANHTFSRQEWRAQVARCTADWILGGLGSVGRRASAGSQHPAVSPR